MIEGLETGAFTYIAHPDIVFYSGAPGFYAKKMTELCRYAKMHDIPLEYNILGYVNKREYPNPDFWKIAAKVGNKAVLGFDAHSPGALKNSQAYNDCLYALEAYGLTAIEFYDINVVNP